MIRSILTAIKPAGSQSFLVEFAATLAQQQQSILEACSVIDLGRLAPAEPVPIGAGTFKSHRDEQIVEMARKDATELISQIEAATRSRNVECRTAICEGDTVKVIASAVQRCDLLVCGHAIGGDASERSLFHAILKHCPRPALIVPQGGGSAEPTVLIAYDGSAQAARALASFAESGLAGDRAVRIVAFDDGSGRIQECVESAKVYLHRHGIAADATVRACEHDPGRQILDEADRCSAGLIVMGAFGRSSVREFFLGSVTKSLLNSLSVPLFLDH